MDLSDLCRVLDLCPVRLCRAVFTVQYSMLHCADYSTASKCVFRALDIGVSCSETCPSILPYHSGVIGGAELDTEIEAVALVPSSSISFGPHLSEFFLEENTPPCVQRPLLVLDN